MKKPSEISSSIGKKLYFKFKSVALIINLFLFSKNIDNYILEIMTQYIFYDRYHLKN